MAKRINRYLFVSLLIIASLLLSVILGLVPVNLFFARDAISEAVQQRLGTELEIQGQLSLKLGFKPQLTLSEIVLHAPAAADAPLAKVGRIQIKPVLLDLMRGDVHLRDALAADVVINYCPTELPQLNTASGESNGPSDMPSIAINKLRLEQVKLQCDRPEDRLTFLPEIFDLEASAGLGKAMTLKISGRNAEESMSLIARGGSLSSLLTSPAEFPLELQLAVPQFSLGLEVVVQNPLVTPGLVAHIEFAADSPTDLLQSAGLDLPVSGPLTFKAQASASFDQVTVSKLEGSTGQNQFSLSGLAKGFTTRPLFEIDAQLSQLDLEMMGEGTRSSGSETDWREISFRSGFVELQHFDGEAHISVDQILNAPLPVTDVDLTARLHDGRIEIEQLEMILADSQVSAQVDLDLNSECPELVNNLQISGVDLKNINQFLDQAKSLGGRVEKTSIRSSSCGETLGEHFDSLQITAQFEQAHPVYQQVDWPDPIDFVSFDSLSVNLDSKQAGELLIDGDVYGEQLSARLRYGSIADFFAEPPWPLELRASGASAQLTLDGDAAWQHGVPSLYGQMRVDISRFGALHAWIGSVPDNTLIGKLDSRIRFDEKGWEISEFESQLGRSDLRGNLSGVYSEDLSSFKAILKSDLLDMNELADLFSESEQEPGQATVEPGAEKDVTRFQDRFAFPSLDFDLFVGRIEGLENSIESVSLHGRVSDSLIEDSRLKLVIEGTEIAGALNADLRQQPWKVDYQFGAGNVDLGRFLRRLGLAQNVTARADRMDFEISSEGQSLRQLLENTRLECRIESLSWVGKLRPEEETANELFLPYLELKVAPSTTTQWFANGKLNDVPVAFWMESPSITETFDRDKNLPLKLVVSSGKDVAILELVLERQTDDILKGDILLSGQHMHTENFQLSDLKSPLEQYEVRSRLTVSSDDLVLSHLQARLGSSELSGQINVDRHDDRTHLGIQLQASRLETDDFVNFMADWRSADQQADEAADIETPRKVYDDGFLVMISQKIDDLTEKVSYSIELGIDEMYSSGNNLGNAQFALMADEKNFRIDPIHIAMPGGIVDAEYYTKIGESSAEGGLKIHIDNLEYGGLFRLLDANSEANGRVYLDTSLHSVAPDLRQLNGGMEGYLDLVIFPDDIEADFLDLWAANLVFALLPMGSGSNKHLNCLVARFEVEDGVMKTKNVLLDSTDIIVRGRGSIDLAKRDLDLVFAPQSKLEKFLSVSAPIEVTGPFDDYHIGVTSGGFVMTMFRWYMSLIYVPWKWLTGERFPSDGIATCFNAMEWDPPGDQD